VAYAGAPEVGVAYAGAPEVGVAYAGVPATGVAAGRTRTTSGNEPTAATTAVGESYFSHISISFEL
jgi:hypothetical protein